MIKIDFTTKPKETIPEYVTDDYGNKFLLDENEKRHSYNDLPAVVLSDGTKHWFKHGLRHRENDLPAIVWFGDTKEYWKNGKRIHR